MDVQRLKAVLYEIYTYRPCRAVSRLMVPEVYSKIVCVVLRCVKYVFPVYELMAVKKPVMELEIYI